MSVRMSATHLYSFHVGCSCTSPIAWTSTSGLVWVKVSSLVIGSTLRRRFLLDEIDEREDRDPHDVDEVPVQRRDVDEERVLRSEPAFDVDREQREQPEHA